MAFPNVKQVARFDPHSQIIILNDIQADDVARAWEGQNVVALRENLATITHEMAHWADTIGTIWGNKYLKNVYSAYELLPDINTPSREFEFYKFMDLHDQARRLSYSEYYHLHFPANRAHHHNHTWRIEFSSGQEFNTAGRVDPSRPILFVRFSDRQTGKPIVRQPLCIAAILETIAMWSELATQTQILALLADDERSAQTYMLNQEFLGRLYTEELTLYTAPVHLLAHFTSITNAALAFQLAALVSLVSLNLVGSHFRDLRPPTTLDVWRERFTNYRRSESIPFAYFVICSNGPKWTPDLSPESWLANALKSSGLPGYSEILGHAVKVLRSDQQAVQREPFRTHQLYLRDIGARWLADRQQRQDASVGMLQLARPELPTPPMFDADGVAFTFAGSTFDQARFDPQLMFDEEAKLHTQIGSFHAGCR